MTVDVFDAKKELLKALRASQYLSQEVKGGFHNKRAKDLSTYPRIVYTEIQNRDDDFADNLAITAEVRYQIGIFCNESTVSLETPIAREVDKIMKSIGYTRYDSVDLVEPDNVTYHKAMRYRKTF